MGDIQGAFDALEVALRDKFIPALFGDGQLVSDRDRKIFALPAREGGMAIDNPAAGLEDKHADSKELTEITQRAILSTSDLASSSVFAVLYLKSASSPSRGSNIGSGATCTSLYTFLQLIPHTAAISW